MINEKKLFSWLRALNQAIFYGNGKYKFMMAHDLHQCKSVVELLIMSNHYGDERKKLIAQAIKRIQNMDTSVRDYIPVYIYDKVFDGR